MAVLSDVGVVLILVASSATVDHVRLMNIIRVAPDTELVGYPVSGRISGPAGYPVWPDIQSDISLI